MESCSYVEGQSWVITNSSCGQFVLFHVAATFARTIQHLTAAVPAGQMKPLHRSLPRSWIALNHVQRRCRIQVWRQLHGGHESVSHKT